MSKSEKSWKNKGLWVLSIVVALPFLMSGGMKLTGPVAMIERFAQWGFPVWFMYFIGLAEVASAIALLVPRLSAYGAAVLGGIMVGATVTHLIFDPPTHALAPVILLALLSVVGWARRPGFLRTTDSLETSRQSI